MMGSVAKAGADTVGIEGGERLPPHRQRNTTNRADKSLIVWRYREIVALPALSFC